MQVNFFCIILFRGIKKYRYKLRVFIIQKNNIEFFDFTLHQFGSILTYARVFDTIALTLKHSYSIMFDKEIPFEIHVTTGDLTINRQDDFVNFCMMHEARPLMIELSKGDFIQQPMFSKIVYSNSFDHVLSVATGLSLSMDSSGFAARRLKIEVPAANSDLFKNRPSNFEKYFEWHCKINYAQVDKLLQLCEKHKVHLSLNALKHATNCRFITLREFGTKTEFEKRISSLSNDLQNGHWAILKQEAEYCIYDNNNLLDHGWLPQ